MLSPRLLLIELDQVEGDEEIAVVWLDNASAEELRFKRIYVPYWIEYMSIKLRLIFHDELARSSR